MSAREGSITAFGVDPGGYGPLPCGCNMIAIQFDPVGPRLCIQYTDSPCNSHTLADFLAVPGTRSEAQAYNTWTEWHEAHRAAA